MRTLLTLSLLTACAAPAFAQKSEIALLGGYTTAGDISKKALGIQDLKVKGSFTFDLQAGRSISDHFGVEASWHQQRSAMVVGTKAGSADLFDMKLDVFQGSLAYRFGSPEAHVVPFVIAGLGATILSAPDLQSETKFSWSVGGGLKWFPSRRVGARVEGRYAPTVLGGSSSDVCDPFGFCQGMLNQFELLGGVVVRF